LKLQHEKLLSNFAFNFNFRRYIKGVTWNKSHGRAVHVDTIKTHVESASGFSASSYNMMNSFQTLLSISTCATAPREMDGAMQGRAVQVDSFKTRVESAYGFNA